MTKNLKNEKKNETTSEKTSEKTTTPGTSEPQVRRIPEQLKAKASLAMQVLGLSENAVTILLNIDTILDNMAASVTANSKNIVALNEALDRVLNEKIMLQKAAPRAVSSPVQGGTIGGVGIDGVIGQVLGQPGFIDGILKAVLGDSVGSNTSGVGKKFGELFEKKLQDEGERLIDTLFKNRGKEVYEKKLDD